MTNDKLITLVRNGSKPSQEAEEFLMENNIGYNVLYDEDTTNLPLIFDSVARDPYKGQIGLNLFKHNHNYKKSA
jgi:hypothetical protein